VEQVVGKEGLNLLINNAGLLPANRDLDVSMLFYGRKSVCPAQSVLEVIVG
jgi:hypothetical protein